MALHSQEFVSSACCLTSADEAHTQQGLGFLVGGSNSVYLRIFLKENLAF
jgi:hypothetical protein